MSGIVLDGIFEDTDETTLEAKVSFDVVKEAPGSFFHFFDSVLDVYEGDDVDDDPDDRTFSGKVYDDVFTVLEDFPEFFENTWADPADAGRFSVEDLVEVLWVY